MSDLIERQAAYDALMAEPLKWDDSSVWESARCHQWMMDMDAIKALSPAQTDSCEGCKHLGKWENEYEYGYPCPCLRCKRRAEDHYER